MSVDILRAQFEAHKQECTNDRVMIITNMKELSAVLESRVSFKHFYWIIGVLVTIQMAVLGFIVNQNTGMAGQIREIEKTTSSVQDNVSFLRGKLSPYDVEFTK